MLFHFLPGTGTYQISNHLLTEGSIITTMKHKCRYKNECKLSKFDYCSCTCRNLSVLGSSLCPESSKGFLGGVIGSGLKWAWGIAKSCGGETSLLFEFVLPAKLIYGMGVKAVGVSLGAIERGIVAFLVTFRTRTGWSLLLERDLPVWPPFLVGLSAADLDRGLPTVGSSPIRARLVGGRISIGRLLSNDIGEGVPERLPPAGEYRPAPCFNPSIVFQRRLLELLKLKFQSLSWSSQDGEVRTMGLWGTPGVRKELPKSSIWELFLFFPCLGSSAGKLHGSMSMIKSYTRSRIHLSTIPWQVSSACLSSAERRS